MLKIGLLTFHRAINYGAVLQTFALQKTLCDAGADCRVIDFRCSKIEHFYDLFKVKKGTLFSKQTVKLLIKYPGKREQKKKFDRFIQKYLNLSEPIYHELERLTQYYDAFVTGSDQVFNPYITGENASVYYLSFVDKKPRFSYAASFGTGLLPEKYQDMAAKELKAFSHISVREESSVDIVKQLTACDASVEADPTLLVDAACWRNLEKKPTGIRGGYILIYDMLTSPLLYFSASVLAKEKNLKVVVLNYRGINQRKLYKDFIYRVSISPEEFLWLMNHAEYILSSSFHGTVFSILFHKKFLSILPEDNPRNMRVIALLKKMGLENRLHRNDSVVEHIEEPIDWIETDRKLCQFKESSMKYIGQIIDSGI